MEVERVIIEASFSPKVGADLGVLLKSGHFGETAADVVEAVVNRFLFEREADGTLDRLRGRQQG